jgi:hypothetical protein
MDATVRPSHGHPCGHRPSVRYRPRDNLDVDPLITLTAGARGSTHKNTISEFKRTYSLPKNIIEPMVSQLNIIAIKYAMNILFFKRKLENNQPLPTALN